MYYATLSTVGDEKEQQKFWNSQENSDDAIKAIELLTGVPREEFSVTSKPKGMVSGPITLTCWAVISLTVILGVGQRRN